MCVAALLVVFMTTGVADVGTADAAAARQTSSSAQTVAARSHPRCPSKKQFLRLERRQNNPTARRVTQRGCVGRWAYIAAQDANGNAYPALFRYSAARKWQWRPRTASVCRHVPRRIHWVCVGS